MEQQEQISAFKRIKRFARPVAFQNWPNSLLPDELKNENPLGIWRTVNNRLSKDVVV